MPVVIVKVGRSTSFRVIEGRFVSTPATSAPVARRKRFIVMVMLLRMFFVITIQWTMYTTVSSTMRWCWWVW